MGECVKTTFNGTFQNDNLKKFGILQLKSAAVSGATANNRKLVLNVSEQCTMSIVEDGYYFQDTQSSSKVRTATIPANTGKTYVFDEGNYTIEIANKYAIKQIGTTEGNWGCLYVDDIEDLEFCSDFYYLFNTHNGTGGTKGSIDKLKNLSIGSLCLNNHSNLSGDVTKIKLLSTDNSRIWLNNTKIYGSIEGFVENNKSLINSSVSCNFSASGTDVTFNGNKVQGSAYTIAFGSSVTVSYGGSVIGTYDGTTWTYNN